MNVSPYFKKPLSKWRLITDKLISQHPIKAEEIVDTILKSWKQIFSSKIGSFSIGKEIFPSPQIMSFLLHELVAHYFELNNPELFKAGKEKHEKDVQCITNLKWSIEIKASSNSNQIFANRSYAQPQTKKGVKAKDGFYITINFEKFQKGKKQKPKILLIRFGYLEHSDWIAQSSATGQQARLSVVAYQHKLTTIYNYKNLKK